MMATNETLSFEDALKKLEKIVSQLEKEDVPLEKAIDFYEEGMKLSKLCDDKLSSAQEKIAKILDEEENLHPFDVEEDT